MSKKQRTKSLLTNGRIDECHEKQLRLFQESEEHLVKNMNRELKQIQKDLSKLNASTVTAFVWLYIHVLERSSKVILHSIGKG